MRAVLLGTGSPPPNPKRRGPATLLALGDEKFLVDAGSGVGVQLVQAGVRPYDWPRVLITHHHSDHMIDLGHLLITRWIVGQNAPFEVWGPAGTKRQMDKLLDFLDLDIEFRRAHMIKRERPRVAVTEIEEGKILEVGGVTVSAFSVDHDPVKPAFGYRFEGGGRRVLSIPLALRQREVEAVVEDLLRTIRLASLVFLAAAAALAVSMSRRISGPVRALTAATHRVAAGDFAARVSPTTRDELQTLVESFNRMAQDLERQRTDLERIAKLAAWAEMARQVAHEVKNPLTPIQLAAEHLRRVYADKSADFGRTLLSCTDTILEQVKNLREIVTEFSSFARPPAPTPERLELAPLVSQVARSYQDVLPREVRLELLPGAAPIVAADRRLVERALVNLVENALQAVGEQGKVRLRVLEDGAGRAVIEVEDSGPGLDPETKARIFEPFFSTKANGSGLGLALVKKIAEDHGGGVSIDSAPGETTRARLWFPPAS